MNVMPPDAVPAAGLLQPDFSGRWATSFGTMTLHQDGARVSGTYGREGTENTIDGTVADGGLMFAYKEGHEQGNGWFRLKRPGHFAGEYLAEGRARALPWQGWRGFDGLWDTSIGRFRFIQDEAHVQGSCEHDATLHLEADIDGGGRFSFRLEGLRVKGRGFVELDRLGYSLGGEWTQDGLPAQPLAGRRVLPRPGLTWLVVLEAHWQRMLDDNEFAFGRMLHELFARVPWALVRHRFYSDEASLLHWCRQLLYLPEPAVLVITGHGETNGLTVEGKTIAMPAVIDALGRADCLRLLHFSACLIGQDAGQALNTAPFPVSGYTTTVDWAQSALTEFIYLDMILEKGLAPARAAEQLLALVRFSGTEELPGSPYRPAGFRFFEPHPEPVRLLAKAAGAGDENQPSRPRRPDFRGFLSQLIGSRPWSNDPRRPRS
jgi:hypothetical protein